MTNRESSMRVTLGTFLPVIALIVVSATIGLAAESPKGDDRPSGPGQQQSAAANKPSVPAVKEIQQPVVGKNYVILPITTNLQRKKGKAYEKAKFFILVNGSALFNEDDTVLNMAPLGLQALRETMQARAQAGVRGDSVIHIHWPVPLPRSKDYGSDSASSAFQSYLEHSYITSHWPGAVHVERLWSNRDWKYANAWESLVADVTKPPPEGADAEEAGVGDDQVRLYAVRTPLSRFLFSGYSVPVDCVIHIIPHTDEAKASAVLTMKRCLPQLNLKQKNFVWFLECGPKDIAAGNASDEFMGEHVWKDLLGFKSGGRMARN